MPSPLRTQDTPTIRRKSTPESRARASAVRSGGAARSEVSNSQVGSVWGKLKLIANSTGLGAHDAVTAGVQVADMRQVMKTLKLIGEKDIYVLLGINARTMQRRADRTLDANASDRALRLVAVTHLAISVLGSQDAAERWLASPAIGLDDRKPIDLLQSSEGTDMVKTLLTRMDYGVYS